jgi:hypothetical protein
MNLYAYVGNDPVNMVDPTGKTTTTAGALIGFTIAGPPGALVGAVAGTVIGVVGVLVYNEMSDDDASDGPVVEGDNSAPEGGTIFVDSNGNALVGPEGSTVSGSPDGTYTQVKDKDGNPIGTRKDGGHSPAGHPDSRAQNPHGHVDGVTNSDGTPWLPLKEKDQ